MAPRLAWAAACAVLALAASSCVDGGSGSGSRTPLTCPEIADSVFSPATATGEPRYRVLSPNGGEVFHVGDTMKVIVTAAEDSEAVASLSVRVGGLTHKLLLPGSPRGDFNARTHCDRSFVIPDSVDDGLGTKLSLVSDSVKVIVAKYNSEATFYDYSDGYFRIVP